MVDALLVLLVAVFSCKPFPRDPVPPPPQVPTRALDTASVESSEVDLDELVELPHRSPDFEGVRAAAALVSGEVVAFRPGRWDRAQRWCVSSTGFAPRLIYVSGEPNTGRKLQLMCDAGGPFGQALAVSTERDHLPNGVALPTGIVGAPGCTVEIPHDFVLPLANEKHLLSLKIPDRPEILNARVYFQLVVAAPGENEAGVLTSRLYELLVGEPLK